MEYSTDFDASANLSNSDDENVQQFRHNSEMFQADGRQIEKLISRLAMWNSFVRPTFESGIDSYDIDCISSLSDHDPLLSQLDMTLSAHCAMLLQPRQHITKPTPLSVT